MVDVRKVFEEDVPAALAAHPELSDQVNGVLQVDISGDGGGAWTIALLRGQAPRVLPGTHPSPTCRIRIEGGDFVELMDGRQRWTDAFVHGRIAVEGDIVTALKLRNLLASFAGP